MKYSLLKGDIKEFAILENKLPENRKNLMVDNGIKAKLNISEKILALVNHVEYSSNEKVLLKIVSILYFKIEDSFWKGMISDNKIIFKKEALQHFGIITIGATRGMLISKCINTSFNELVLPPINIQKLLNEDIIFELE